LQGGVRGGSSYQERKKASNTKRNYEEAAGTLDVCWKIHFGQV
jgi:hypothetical protein